MFEKLKRSRYLLTPCRSSTYSPIENIWVAYDEWVLILVLPYWPMKDDETGCQIILVTEDLQLKKQ